MKINDQTSKERYAQGFAEAVEKVLEEIGHHHAGHATTHLCECKLLAERVRRLMYCE